MWRALLGCVLMLMAPEDKKSLTEELQRLATNGANRLADLPEPPAAESQRLCKAMVDKTVCGWINTVCRTLPGRSKPYREITIESVIQIPGAPRIESRVVLRLDRRFSPLGAELMRRVTLPDGSTNTTVDRYSARGTKVTLQHGDDEKLDTLQVDRPTSGVILCEAFIEALRLKDGDELAVMEIDPQTGKSSARIIRARTDKEGWMLVDVLRITPEYEKKPAASYLLDQKGHVIESAEAGVPVRIVRIKSEEFEFLVKRFQPPSTQRTKSK